MYSLYKNRYIKTCVQLAACPVENYLEVRTRAFDDMMKASQDIDDGKSRLLPLEILLRFFR